MRLVRLHVFVITGDFNHVTLDFCLTGFVQYANCPLRLLSFNTMDAYSHFHHLVIL